MQRIMIIDDDESIRESLGVYSEMLGYEPVLFTGPESCNVFHIDNHACSNENHCAEILIVEQNMKKMTGLDFIQQQLDKGCKHPARHKVVISDSLTRKEFMQAKKLGCHVLQKPVTYEIFERWVKELVSETE